MVSKMVTARQKRAEAIAVAIATHGEAIASSVQTKMAERDVKPVPVRALLDFAVGELNASLAAATEADSAHAAELADDQEPRDARDTAVEHVRTRIIALKSAATTLFGDVTARALRFPADVPKEATQVERTAKGIIAALEAKGLPAPTMPGVKAVSAKEWIAYLSGGLDAIATARADVMREVQEARATQRAKDAAIADLDAALVAAAQLTVALARIGGTSHLVAGLRGTDDRHTSTTDDPSADDDMVVQPVTDLTATQPVTRGASVPPAAPSKPMRARAVSRRKR